MRWRVSASCLAACIAAPAAVAAPPYAEARTVVQAMFRPVSEAPIWAARSVQSRIAAARDAQALVLKSDMVFGADPFGPFSACYRAVRLSQDYVGHLNDLARVADGSKAVSQATDLLFPMQAAARFGDDYRSCSNLVEALGSAGAMRKG